MSLAASIRDDCNRLVGENDMITIYFIQFDAVSCEETSLFAKVVILFESYGNIKHFFDFQRVSEHTTLYRSPGTDSRSWSAVPAVRSGIGCGFLLISHCR